MGGYGAARIGLRHADTFGALYPMSPCCTTARSPQGFDPAAEAQVAALASPADPAPLPFGTRGMLARAAAFALNPDNPPLYLDLPMNDNAVRPEIMAKWQVNSSLNFVEQYVSHLRGYTAIAMDVGDADGLRTDTQALREALERWGIGNSLEFYSGDHASDIGQRMLGHVNPFLAEHPVHGRGA